MSFPNPSVLININTSKTITAQKPEYLRTFAICSCGDTNLDVGDSKLVSLNDYEAILKPEIQNNYTKKWLASFFKNCVGKMALVIECGTQNSTILYPPYQNLQLQNQLECEVGETLQNAFTNDYNYTFAYNDNDTESNKLFNLNINNKEFTITGKKAGTGFLKVTVSGKDISTTYFILKVKIKDKIRFSLDSSLELNVKTDVQNQTSIIQKNVNINTNATILNATILNATNESPSCVLQNNQLIIQSGTQTGEFDLKIQTQASDTLMQAYILYKVKIIASGQVISQDVPNPKITTEITEITDLSNFKVLEKNEVLGNVDVLKNYIKEAKKTRAYKYSVPRVIMANESFLDLVSTYSLIDSSTYFSGETQKGIDPNQDPIFTKLKSFKGFFGVFNNCESPNDILDGGLTGIMSSSAYDISLTTQMSPLCFKYISFNFNKVSNSFNEILTNAPVSWVSYQAGKKVIFGGRYCDGEMWDYWYSWDNVRESVKSNVETFIINSVNTLGKNPLSYDKSGIANIALNLQLSLENCVNLGFINQFGERLNIETNQIENKGKIGFIDFDTYIKSEPDDYAKGIYKGYSAFVRIGRFILQISFNVNIG